MVVLPQHPPVLRVSFLVLTEMKIEKVELVPLSHLRLKSECHCLLIIIRNHSRVLEVLFEPHFKQMLTYVDNTLRHCSLSLIFLVST